MNEKQLNKNPGISKSINIHTASLDSLFIIHIFIASSLSRIFENVYFLFAIQIWIGIYNLICIYTYTQIYGYTYVYSFFPIQFAILLSCTFLPLWLFFPVCNYGSDFISFETFFISLVHTNF